MNLDFRSYPVRLTSSPEKGRYFLAKSNIKVGEVVLKCSPLATAPFDNHKKRLECYKNDSNVLTKHELICNISRKIATWSADKHMKSVVRLLVQILLEYLWEKKYNDNEPKNDTLRNYFKDFLLLKSHYLDWSINLKQDWMRHKNFLLSIFKSSNLIQENIEFDEFLHMVSRIESNGFGMYYQSKGREILFGRAIYPFASFFNHSCDANCDALQPNYRGENDQVESVQTEINSSTLIKKKETFRKVEFIALHNINEGEELTISYIADTHSPLQLRRLKQVGKNLRA
ncbi:histone-lysine N-methyltransferase SMYD1-like [Rhizophagus clarus]|uniref:Histone-lysine N-methyltransferase SMYD1-like n=1 Tax=Rhizophagus clarus TaxID=94130 RepID=A0A8H3LPI9_9GLOM|nr:histone-lysine N-methyltransferase SMYD1-like [Rhizophagus clarus]